MRVFPSILVILGLLWMSGGFTVCGSSSLDQNCCCHPEPIVQTVTDAGNCCDKTQPAAPVSKTRCGCALVPLQEDLPHTFTLPAPEEGRMDQEFFADPALIPFIHPASVHAGPCGMRSPNAPPGFRPSIFDLHVSYRL